MKALSDKKLLEYWRKAVIEKAGHKCEYPNCSANYTQLHAHHVFSRRGVATRYSLNNALCLCAYHHTMGSFSAHSDPTFMATIISCGVRSEEWLDGLIIERRKVQKNTKDFKQYCFEELQPYL